MVAYIFALKILFGPFRTYRSCTVVTIEEIRRIEENLFRVLRLVLKVSAVEEGGSFHLLWLATRSTYMFRKGWSNRNSGCVTSLVRNDIIIADFATFRKTSGDKDN